MLRPTMATPASTNGAFPDEVLQTTFLAFPRTNAVGAAVDLAATFNGLFLPTDYATNTLALTLGAIITAANSPNTSNALFRATILRHNTTGGNVSTNDAQVGPFDAGSSVLTLAFASSASGTNKVTLGTVLITNCTLAAGEPFSLKLERANATDATLANVGVTHAALSYTK